ncbi:hypothetical protein BC834DRAFT_621035 [Gloeopeniophorella convolvens]|nr:hypothetical protein BC834DRAFT_621035 [Gloeopeniophorella convolvens]
MSNNGQTLMHTSGSVFEHLPGTEAGQNVPAVRVDRQPSPLPRLNLESLPQQHIPDVGRSPDGLPNHAPDGTGTPAYPPHQPNVTMAAQQAVRPQDTGFSDSSGPLFSMYNRMAADFDARVAEDWKGGADGILIFTGLFSATVATFLAGSYPNLQLNSQDASAFYLAHLYQLNAGPDGSSISNPSTFSDPSTFSPSPSTIWVNVLWFLSLIISLMCALLATLLQQWVRRYLHITQPRFSPHKRARIREFMAQGVEKLRLPWVVEALPALLHISVFFFFVGLVIFLLEINHTVYTIVRACVGICAGLYLCISLVPIFRHDSPYSTPLSTLIWTLQTGVPWLVLKFVSMTLEYFKSCSDTFVQCCLSDTCCCCCWCCCCTITLEIFSELVSVISHRISPLHRFFKQRIMNGMVKACNDSALAYSPELDFQVLSWTFKSLDEDHELEQFLDGIPGLLTSSEVDSPDYVLGRLQDDYLANAILALMGRSWHPTWYPRL